MFGRDGDVGRRRRKGWDRAWGYAEWDGRVRLGSGVGCDEKVLGVWVHEWGVV